MDQSRFALATCAKCASAYGLCGSQYGKSRGSLILHSLWWFVQLTVGIPLQSVANIQSLKAESSLIYKAPNGPSSTASFSNCLGFSRCVVDAEHLGMACDLRFLIVVS